MTLGSCLATALLLVWSRIESLGALYAVWALMGLAMPATLYEPAFAAIVGWFPLKDRDRALLIVTLVAALASTIFMPFEAWLVNRLGWRGALSALALILAVPTRPIRAIVRRRPPRGSARSKASSPGVTVRGLTLGAAAKAGVFWVLGLAFLASNFTTNTVTVHLIPYLSDRGYSPTLVAAMIGWMGAMQLPARVVFGPLVARFGHRTLTVGIFVFQAVALAQLALVRRLGTLAPMVVMLGAGNDHRRDLRTAPLRVDQRRHRARSQRRARGRAVRGRAPAGGARRLRARVLAPGGRARPGGPRSPGGAVPRSQRMIAPVRLR